MAHIAYLDSSAVVKTVVEEPESGPLSRFLRDFETHVSSAIARTEVIRAVRRSQPFALPRAYMALQHLVLIELSEGLLDGAGRLDPPTLRSLDALHVVTALMLLPELDVVVTYDERMLSAASAQSLPVEMPR